MVITIRSGFSPTTTFKGHRGFGFYPQFLMTLFNYKKLKKNGTI